MTETRLSSDDAEVDGVTHSSDRLLRVLTLTRDVGHGSGGAERLAYEFALRLDPRRFRSYMCLTHAPRKVREASTAQAIGKLEDAGVRTLRLERRSSLHLTPWRALYRLLRSEQIDILHAHMPRSSVPGTIIGRLARVPLIVSHEHGWAFQGKPLRRWLDREVVARGSNVMLAVSEWDRRHMSEVEGIPAQKIRVLHNGIAWPAVARADLRSELLGGMDDRPSLIVAVGRLYPEKDHQSLVRAMAVLRDRHLPVRCVIVGDGPEEERLRTMVTVEGLTDHVQLLGRRGDVSDVLRAADIAVLPSQREGSPLAMMEYMASGAAIVATEVGGVPELVRDGVDGLLVPSGDVRALADAIASLVNDRDLARRMGTQAQQRQRREFDLDVTVHNLEALYEELCAQHRQKQRPTR